MSIAVDTSVLVAAMVADEPRHAMCAALLDRADVHFYSHGVLEAFSTLTGGRRAFRLPASLVSEMLTEDFLPSLRIVAVPPSEMSRHLKKTETYGVRGGAVFDYMHLVAAKKSGASRFYTLNLSHFRAIARDGDPEILLPS